MLISDRLGLRKEHQPRRRLGLGTAADSVPHSPGTSDWIALAAGLVNAARRRTRAQGV